MCESRRSCIVGSGGYLPKKKLYNSYFYEDLGLDTTEDWIVSRTGIKSRNIVDGETTVDMAYFASLQAIEDAKLQAEDIDCVIFSTTTPNNIFPASATLLQDRIGCNKAFCFDLQAVCSGFVYALSVANSFIISGQASKILVVGADSMSKIVDWKDRNTSILFGDGAGAVVVQGANNSDCNSGIISSHLYSDGSCYDILKVSGGVFSGEVGKIYMNGREVFKKAIANLCQATVKELDKNGVSVDDLDFLVPHQANVRIIDAIAERINIPKEKVVSTVHKHANTSAASIPLALNDLYISEGKNLEGKLVLMLSVGAGLTWGSILVRF